MNIHTFAVLFQITLFSPCFTLKSNTSVNSYYQNTVASNISKEIVIKVYYETLCPASVDFFAFQLQPTIESLSSYVEIVLIPYGHAQYSTASTGFDYYLPDAKRYWILCLYNGSSDMEQCPDIEDRIERRGPKLVGFVILARPSRHCSGHNVIVLYLLQTKYVNGSYEFRCQHGPAECYGNTLHACAIDVIKNSTAAVLFNACMMQYSVYTSSTNVDFISAFNWCGYQQRVNLRAIWMCLNSVEGRILLKSYGEVTRTLRPRYVPFIVVNGAPDERDEASSNLMAAVCRLLPSPPPSCYMFLSHNHV